MKVRWKTLSVTVRSTDCGSTQHPARKRQRVITPFAGAAAVKAGPGRCTNEQFVFCWHPVREVAWG